MMHSRLLLAFFVIVFVSLTTPAHALIQIDVSKGVVEPLPIAITDMNGSTGEENALGADIARVVAADLERSGLFRPIDKRAFIEQVASGKAIPHFPSWRSIKASALVTADISFVSGGKVAVEFRLWDIFAEQQITGKAYTTTRENWRRIGHMIADAIYSQLTGEEGYFDTRIVYISESGLPNNRIKRLAIMDQDGANHKLLTTGTHLALTPRFSPVRQQILYMSYANNKPRVHLYELNNNRDRVLGDFPGMSFAPRFSPDNTKAILSAALNGNSEIYELDLSSGAKRQLTNDPGIDTSPSYSPDQKQIVFNSDRGGSQQLYVMNSDGSNVRRISFGQGRYGTPVWSPRGDLIAFTKMTGGSFYIGVMRPDGSGERSITEGYLVEGPTWAPNGRVIMFTRQTPFRSNQDPGSSRIITIDLTGYNEREMMTPADGSDPAWSPLLN